MKNEYLNQLNATHPNGSGFNNSYLTMDWGSCLALIPKNSIKKYNKEVEKILEAVNIFCKENNISVKSKKNFLCETNEYSLK